MQSPGALLQETNPMIDYALSGLVLIVADDPARCAGLLNYALLGHELTFKTTSETGYVRMSPK